MPLFADIEAELTYLFVRALKPETVVEISPAGGWSTSWILSALRDNHTGTLFSYDLMDDATRTLPESLWKGRWVFTQGDVRRNVAELPTNIDYLFLDADHSREFAEWYILTVFPKLRDHAMVSIDDVFRDWTVDRPSQFGEAQVVLDWLSNTRTPFFTASRHHAKDSWNSICLSRQSNGIDDFIVPFTGNPAVFFYHRSIV